MFGIKNAMQQKMNTVIKRAYTKANKRKTGLLAKKEFKYMAI